MKPEKVSVAPQERYVDFLCHPFGILFCYELVSIIMTSLRDLVGRGFCFFAPSVSPPRWEFWIVAYKKNRAVILNPNPNISDFVFLMRDYLSIHQKALMRKLVIIVFVICIAAVMSARAQTAESYFTAGYEKYKKGLYKEAISDYTKAIELSPQAANAYYNRGLAKFSLGDKKGALADYTKAIELDPQYAKAYSNRAVIYYNEGETTLACADFQKAKELGLKQAAAMIEENCK